MSTAFFPAEAAFSGVSSFPAETVFPEASPSPAETACSEIFLRQRPPFLKYYPVLQILLHQGVVKHIPEFIDPAAVLFYGVQVEIAYLLSA